MSTVSSRSQSAAGHSGTPNEKKHDPLLDNTELWPLYAQNVQPVDQSGLVPNDQAYPQTSYPLNDSSLNTLAYFDGNTSTLTRSYSSSGNPDQQGFTGVNGSVENNSNFTPSDLANLDFLTPEQSSENFQSDFSTHTTPNIEDPQWPQQSYVDSTTNGNTAEHNYGFTDLEDTTFPIPTTSQFANQYPGQISNFPTTIAPQLLSPQLTNTTNSPSPPAKHPEVFLAQRSTDRPSPSKTMPGQRSFQPPGIQVVGQPTPGQSGASSSNSGQASPLEPIARAVSPSILVSSYNRGDSPRRSDFPSGRSVGKRSRASSRASSHLSPQLEEDSSDEDIGPLESSHHHAGIGPSSRGDELVSSSINTLATERETDEKNAEVEEWLSKSEVGSEAGDVSDSDKLKRQRMKSKKNRIRAHSMGAHSRDVGFVIYDDSNIPGPGALIDESEGDEDEDDSSASSRSLPDSPAADAATVTNAADPGYFPSSEGTNPENEEPLPKQFYRPRVWQDPASNTPVERREGEPKDQPFSSNAAIMRFQNEAARIETASRAATWGTGRRLSDSDVSAMVSLRKLSLQERVRERKSTILNQASKLVPGRSSSYSRRKDPEASQNDQSPDSAGGAKRRGESLSSLKALQRISSISKPTTPPLNTGSALMAMTGQIAAVGGSNSVGPAPSPSGPTGHWTKAIKRSRSKSDVPSSSSKSKGTPGLSQLMTNLGGPPMLNVSPVKESAPDSVVVKRPVDEDDDEDEEDDENMEGQSVKMDLPIRSDSIVPNLDGFKTHVQQLNPRLQDFLVERIAAEQVRRYKKLLESKVKHTHAVNVTKKCASGAHCFQLGGDATMLPLRTSVKDPETTYAQFQIRVPGEEDDESTSFGEGAVTAALFPQGIPLPPVKRLPAEFECTLCYKVKKFQKPSDWTKHVHEDVQPFTCTFPNCTEPKSFKRKADWVRHENERHRQLEWWQCSIPECNHICYRKDNFVQHLVREHKRPEPKIKTRGSSSSKARPVQGATDQIADWRARIHEQEIEEVWRLVESCRHDTTKKPKDEACKFCGNVCNSWKKLTVHLAKHMEQIAMPVLDLVKQKEVSPTTIISPIDRPPMPGQQQSQRQLVNSQSPMVKQPNSSPYLAPNVALQPSMPSNSLSGSSNEYYGATNQQTPIYDNSSYPTHIPPQQSNVQRYQQPSTSPYQIPYAAPYSQPQSTQFPSVNNPSATTYPPPYNAVHRSSPNAFASHPAQGQFELSNTIPTTLYGQQSTQDVYSSPTEGAPYGESGSPFDVGIARTQGMQGMAVYGPSRTGMANPMQYGHGQGQSEISYDILQPQRRDQGQGHSGSYGYQQQ